MTDQEFKQLVNFVIMRYQPATGLNLEGMIEDFQRILEKSRSITNVKVYRTSDLTSLIRATCEPLSHNLNRSQIAADLEDIWLKKLRYRAYEAHMISRSDNSIDLNCLTAVTRARRQINTDPADLPLDIRYFVTATISVNMQ